MCPTFCVVLLVLWMVGLVKVILTGDRCGGRELAMLCMMLLILGLLPDTAIMGEAMGMPTPPFEMEGADTLATSFSTTGEEPDEELVRRRLRGFSSSSEQLTPGRGRRGGGGN